MKLRSYKQFEPFSGKRVIVRANFDVSVENGAVQKDSTWRLDAAMPLLKELSDAGARTVVISHRGRPEGVDPDYSLRPIVAYLSTNGFQVTLGVGEPAEGGIVVRENIRFDKREAENDLSFVKELSELGEVFINDDFATSHRAHSSNVGISKLLPSAAGPLFLREISELTRASEMGGEGLLVIIGGAKAETKVKLVSDFIEKGATVLIGGVIANTILKLRGVNVGKSLIDNTVIPEFVVSSEKLIAPTDVVVSTSIERGENVTIKGVGAVEENEYILDIGVETQKLYNGFIGNASYIIWNGPFGLVEMGEFRSGTQAVGKACLESHAYKLIGGGDIVTFISQEGLRDKFDYVSTGGGAMLSYLAGEYLPALDALKE